MNTQELARLRLVAQRIAGPGAPSARDAVHGLMAIQAQDHPGAITSIALRTQHRSRPAVVDALTAGELVKSWPMRGTLHVVVAEDLPWLQALTAPRMLLTLAGRHRQLGLTEAELERAEEIAIGALSGGRELSRSGMLATWEQAGLDVAGQRGYHFIVHLAHTGVLCFGPIRDGEPQLVLLAEWVPNPRRLEREESLGELARRYFRGHGPATVKDFTRWGKLVAADVRAGVALARPELDSVTMDGVEYLMDPQTPERLAADPAAVRGVFLLPGFDEYMLGYGDRTAALPARFADRIVPGGNGMFVSTVVADGQVVGTWRRSGRGVNQTVQVTPFEPLSARATKAVDRAYANLP